MPENGNVRVTVPMSFRSCSGRKRIAVPDPEIVHAVLAGNLPDSFSVDRLKQALPVLWSVQKKMLGIGC